MKRLPPEDRKRLIARQLLPLFAQQGFAATNSKQMANSAGVSEALIYKYFPTKDDIYKDIERECVESSGRAIGVAQQLPDSAETAALIVYGLIRQISLGSDQWFEQRDMVRLMFHSYLSDGAFAQLTHDEAVIPLLGKLRSSLMAAAKAGDAHKTGISAANATWLCHHVAAMVALVPIASSNASPKNKPSLALVEDATRFCLRGLGLTDDAMNRFVDFKKLAAQYERLLVAGGEAR
jgi:TetR/AcrR family transcriptional regulator, transcriptional repressor of aconitase